MSEVCNLDPTFTLHIAGLRVANSKSVIVKSWNIVESSSEVEKNSFSILPYNMKKSGLLRSFILHVEKESVTGLVISSASCS